MTGDRPSEADVRESLVAELQHYVKNNLQLIDSLLMLQASRADAATARHLLQARIRIRALALAYDHVHEAGEPVDVQAYFQGLVAELFSRHVGLRGRVSAVVDVSARAALALEQALRCGLIVTELVSNCLQHAFPQGRHGRVVVSLALLDEGGEARLVVSDDGVGLPADLNVNHVPSLGLRLVSELVGQLRGRLDLQTVPRAGTEVQIAFP